MFRRFSRWTKSGVWDKIREELIKEPDFEWLMIDGSHIKVHPHAVGMIPVIPPKSNRKEQREYDKYLYKLRHLVENAFLYFKRWRGIAYAKTTKSFLAAVNIRCIFLWAKLFAV
jgi:transposase